MKTQRYIPVGLLHRKRYAKLKAGMSVDDIAAEAGVDVKAIEISIRKVETQQQLFNLQSMEEKMIEDILDLAAVEKQAILEALQADRLIYNKGDDGVAGDIIAAEPDHETRLKASHAITEKQKAIYASRAKGSSINVNTQVGVGVAAGNGDTGFESMLREIQKRRRVDAGSQSELPPVGTVIEVVPEREKLTIDGGSKTERPISSGSDRPY